MDKFPFSLIVAIAWSALTGLYGQNSCLPDGISFTSQAQVDSFPALYPGCTVIEGDIDIEGQNITHLDSLWPVTFIGGDVIFLDVGFQNLNGLQGLTSVGGDLHILYNLSLTSLEGLDNLKTVGGFLVFQGNNALTNFDGLDSLESVGGFFSIHNNAALTDFSGLNSLTTIGGFFKIYGNHALLSTAGLESLTAIGGNLQIGAFFNGNSSLASLSGFENLSTVNGSLSFFDNSVLSSLNGLENLDYFTYVNIRSNESLSVCSIQPICDYLENGGGSNFSDNAPGCNTQQEVENACLAVSVDDLLLDDAIRIFPNPTTGVIQVEVAGDAGWSVRVLDAMGRMVVPTHPLENGEVDLQDVPTGLYFLELSSGRYSITRRVVKQ